MSFQDKDRAFQTKVVNALFQRHMINQNKEVGTAYLQPECEDRINPRVTISPQDIKTATGREKLRNIVVREYVKAFNLYPGVIARNVTETDIEVAIEPVRSRSNEFDSVSALCKSNAKDLNTNPELGESTEW
ncbi:hypothetical protein [Marinobacter sp. ANT_B65]|uniref:hypothetical protein n=1 Tax=Marinobacter sp. ANT_B65 TaxID=2039467 RepID=UPI000BBE27E4|nr:hypothetical protein [Marinobacter sp. ANT_B65]PCM43771.1 hypothetical protein CPA50_15565 [Marinobacter sp. ANT_B65]